ncbi:NADP-dependent oxidoreductase [Streptomyces physcomitrii]|uniref:NADP-dependent oxidoreductase n=1 Tax=Streptomyces physcomitrii TaxID=2724184 RepID=UPI0033FF1D18
MPEAIAFAEYGPPEVLEAVTRPRPEPGPGQVLVAVRAAGVNPLDWKLRGGAMAAVMPLALPHVPGLELAGTVDALGEGVEGLTVGEEVFGKARGAYAAYALAEADQLARRPEDLDPVPAAGVAVAAEAAYRALDELGPTEGETLLVHGAAGAVGSMAAQFARARGARVLGTASAPAQDRVRELGAETVVYGEGVAERLRSAAPEGVDAVLDTSGADVLGLSVALAGGTGRVLSLVDPVAAEQHGVRFSAGTPDEDRTAAALEQVLVLHRAGTLALPVPVTLPLAEAAEAHRWGERGGSGGKLLLLVG